MKHVSFCGGLRWRALVVMAVAAVFYLLSAAPANALNKAATPSPQTVTPGVETQWCPGDVDDPASCTVEGSIGDGAECENPFAGGNCSSEDLEATAEGIVEVVITWTQPPAPVEASDLSLFVYRCNTPASLLMPLASDCTQVAQSIRATGNSERAVFRVTNNPDPFTNPLCPQPDAGGIPCAAPGTFQARTTPASVLVSQGYDGCAAYDNDPQNGLCPDPFQAAQPEPEPAGQFFAGCPDGGVTGDRKITGGGFFRFPNDQKEHFNVNVERDNQGDDDDGDRKRDDDDGDGRRAALEGSVRWRSEVTGQRFRTRDITCATFFDDSQSAVVRGIGTLRESTGTQRTVCFENTDDDNGKNGGTENGGSDSFVISFFDFDPGTSEPGDETCNNVPGAGETHGGPISRGQITYHFKA